jgi:heme oxygenase (biliverdin-producing, ferredoxin)
MVLEGYPNIALKPLSIRLRDETQDVHEAAERSRFMSALLGGELGVEHYARLITQYQAIYGALESAATQHDADSTAAPFAHPALSRIDALARDITALGGQQHAITSATVEYVDRINEVCTQWAGGFVAHHYVRYLGDLSGGQFIRRILRRQFDLADDRGLSFYVFEHLDSGVKFKQEYRESLDTAPWSAQEQDLVVDEARRAFELNIALFASLE